MKRLTATFTAGLMAATFAGSTALADPVDDTLILNGETEIVTRTAAPAAVEGALSPIIRPVPGSG